MHAVCSKFPLLPWEHISLGGNTPIVGKCFSIILIEKRRIATFLHYSFGGIPDTVSARIIFDHAWTAYDDAFGKDLRIERGACGERIVVTPVLLTKKFFASGDWALEGTQLDAMECGTWYAITQSDMHIHELIEFQSEKPRSI